MKIFAKAKEFYVEHKSGIHTFLKWTAGILVVGAGIYIVANMDDNDRLIETVSSKEDSNWDEKYRTSFDMVESFAKTLPLYNGESYIIERYDEYSNGNIVSHLVDGIGVYPLGINHDYSNEEESENEDTV